MIQFMFSNLTCGVLGLRWRWWYVSLCITHNVSLYGFVNLIQILTIISPVLFFKFPSWFSIYLESYFVCLTEYLNLFGNIIKVIPIDSLFIMQSELETIVFFLMSLLPHRFSRFPPPLRINLSLYYVRKLLLHSHKTDPIHKWTCIYFCSYWIHFHKFGLHFVVFMCVIVFEWMCMLFFFPRILFPFLLYFIFLVWYSDFFCFDVSRIRFQIFILYRCILSHISFSVQFLLPTLHAHLLPLYFCVLLLVDRDCMVDFFYSIFFSRFHSTLPLHRRVLLSNT